MKSIRSKLCQSCSIIKPEALFFKRGDGSGFRSLCKECFLLHNRDLYKSRLQVESERRKRYYRKNRRKVLLRICKYRKNNKSHVAKLSAARWPTYKDRYRPKRRAYYFANKKKKLAMYKVYYSKNPERYQNYRQRRISRIKGAKVNDFTGGQWLRMKQLFRYRCSYCGKKKPLSQDHIVPVSKGGNHTWRNIVPSCIPCNSSKRDGAPFPFKIFPKILEMRG